LIVAIPSLIVACAILWSLLLAASRGETASLAEIRQTGTWTICAHPDALPFSSQNRAQPGLQLEIADAIATHLGVRLNVNWIVFTRHARRAQCDALMGSISQGTAAPSGGRGGPQLTKPYAGGGYMLVVPPSAVSVQRVEDVKGGKIGVEHTSWAHYLLNSRGIATASYVSQWEILEAVTQGAVAGGVVTGPYLGWYLKQHPDAVKIAIASIPDPELRWNVAVRLLNADQALVDAVNQLIDQLLADQTIPRIFAKYGITYLPPTGQ
jgi:polar amino acid transport system substrate-binding protein